MYKVSKSYLNPIYKATYSAIKFDGLINSKMSFICPVCSRSFSQRTAYTQHIQKCIKKLEVEGDDVEMDSEGDQNSNDENDPNNNDENDPNSNDENDNVEVIIRFLSQKKFSIITSFIPI